MACNCGGKATTYLVKYPNGGTRGPFLSKQEATVIAASGGGSVIPVTK